MISQAFMMNVSTLSFSSSFQVIEEADFEDVKVKFYRMMVEYHSNEKSSWDICQCYYKVRKMFGYLAWQGRCRIPIDLSYLCVYVKPLKNGAGYRVICVYM
jgi:hypothetical protein